LTTKLKDKRGKREGAGPKTENDSDFYFILAASGCASFLET